MRINTSIKIRIMTSEDKPLIIKILKSTPEFKPSEVTVAQEVIDDYLSNPESSGYQVLVAEVDSAVAGYICFGATPLAEGTWDIYWMAVAPEKRGRGIGGALLASAENRIKQAQGRLVFIETSSKENYEATRRFHRHQGYEEICRIPDFYEPGDDKLTLWKRL